MPSPIKTVAAIALGALLATSALAQSAKDLAGASPYVALENEPPPRLVVDPPIAAGLPLGVFWAQYHVENLRIVPVFGMAANKTSPRVGHLHVTVDDLPWWWADPSNTNTIDIAGFTPGEHKVKVELVDTNHDPFPGQATTLHFTIPQYDRAKVHPHAPPLRSN